MQNIQETLVRQFWSHVFSSPDKPAVLVKNEGPRQSQFIAGGGVRFGAPSVVTVKAPAMRPLSFKDVGHIVSEFMAFLSDNGFKKGDRAAILSWNRPEWVWCDLAIQSLGGITVPIYPNSSAEQVAYIVQDAGASFLFVEHDEQLDDLTAAIAPDLNVYQTTFSEVMAAVPDYTGRTLPQPKFNEPIQPLKLEFSRRSSLRLKQVRWQYIASFNPRATSPFLGLDPQDVATIIYTSGSTGVPKGAVLTHRNIASSCQALMRHGFDFTPQDVYLSYLPLAHVYERVNGQAMCIWNAVPVAFCRVDELGDALKLVQPTILLGVPAVWRKMKDKIESELRAAKGMKARLIGWALSRQEHTWQHKLADSLVLRKVRAELGGRLRLIMSGGAAISPDILTFFHKLGLDLRQGYGLTETTGGIAAETPRAYRAASVGKLIDTVDVKIVPEEGVEAPAGVIWLRGDSIFKGYWNLPAENARAFDEDGWFYTGDIGWLDDDGYLHISGRKKRLGKTDGGKYFSYEKIETAFDTAPIVQCVVPTGDGRPFIGALIFVNLLEAKALLSRENGAAPEVSADEYFTNAAVVKAVAAAVERANTQLEHWETIKQYEIVPAAATVENGLLTATLKVRSEEVLKRYGSLVELIYSRKH